MRRRVWIYGKGQWDGNRVIMACDEYGRRTLVFPLPGQRALVFALWRCGCPVEDFS